MSAPWYDSENLPKFDRPPVFETALAIEFGPVRGLDFYQLAKLQDLWSTDYPVISDVPGAPPTSIDGAGEPIFMMGPGPQRIWAAAIDNGQLVQTQADRLILNWRKAETPAPYPGYLDHLRGELERLWHLLTNHLAQINLPAPIPVLAEFTYINVVPLAVDERLQDVLTMVRNPDQDLPGRDRFTRFQVIRDITASEDDPFTAQINIAGEPNIQLDGTRGLAITVVGRVVLGALSDDPLAGLDAAHALASHTFARVLTKQKQQEWGRRR